MSKTTEHFAIEEAQSEIRTRVLEIRAIPDDKLTTELRTERDTLDKKYAEGEVKFRASLKAMQAEQEKGVTIIDAEARELAALTERASVGDIYAAAIEKRQTSGEVAELQKHYGLSAHQVPLEMLRINRSVEERAAATVPASIGDAVQGEAITPVFASGDGAFLGIERPTVPVGSAAYPVCPRLRPWRVRSPGRMMQHRPTRHLLPTRWHLRGFRLATHTAVVTRRGSRGSMLR